MMRQGVTKIFRKLLNEFSLLGPGIGKGTQAERIAEEFNLKVFSTGDICVSWPKRKRL